MSFQYDDNIELLSNTIPKNTKHLYFGDNFNQSVDMLPLSIIYLYFGYNFNQSVDMLPQSIKILEFGYSFNQSVEKLPTSIECVYFGHNFNQSIDMLPTSIECLYFFNKCLLKILRVSNRRHVIYKNKTEYNARYTLTKEKCIKNENTPFGKHKITFDMIHKNKKEKKLFYNIKKIPYGCIYDSIVYT